MRTHARPSRAAHLVWIASALFGPLRTQVQWIIDRRFYRQRYEAAQTLARFSEAVVDEVDVARLTDRLAGAVNQALQPGHVSVWLKDSPTATTRTAGARSRPRRATAASPEAVGPFARVVVFYRHAPPPRAAR